MISNSDLKKIVPKLPTGAPSSAHIISGIPIPKGMRVRMFSPDEWEGFVEEWSTSLSGAYLKVRRLGGSGDLGIDIAAFCTEQGFDGAWDNFQCKRYDHPLRPSDIWVEIGKIIFYSRSEYTPPRKHYFVCSQGISTALEKLLNRANELKAKAKENWDKYCESGITTTETVKLTGALATYFDEFDFSIFTSKSHIEMIEGHSKTGYHIVRFGGGLPPRPASEKPPESPAETESRYIRQLLDVYGEQIGSTFTEPAELDSHTSLKRDYLRQRERFYHAEALRNFARDTVPEGTFANLQDEIYHGVIDICEGTYANGFERMRAAMAQAASLTPTANPLSSVTQKQDCQGICHQLANDDRVTWMPNDA